MSLNKRYFSWDSIFEKASQSDFTTFESWLVKPDVKFYEDEMSAYYADIFFACPEEHRKIIFKHTTEGPIFLEDLFKLIAVVTHKENKEQHLPFINQYKELWRKKWEMNIEIN